MEVGAGAAGTVCDWKEVRADGFVRLEAWKERGGKSCGNLGFCDVPGASLEMQGVCTANCRGMRIPALFRAPLPVRGGGQVSQYINDRRLAMKGKKQG